MAAHLRAELVRARDAQPNVERNRELSNRARTLRTHRFQAANNFFGGGDAETSAERFYFTFVCIVGAVLQAIIFGSFANVLKNFNQEYADHQRRANQTIDWMTAMHLPEELQDRVCVRERLRAAS